MDGQTGVDGGNVIFTPSKTGPTDVRRFMAGKATGDGKDGAVIFLAADGDEVIRLESGGRVLVRGELCDDNPEICAVFRAWLDACTTQHPTAIKDEDARGC